MKVLLVEDDLHTRNIIEMVLKRDRALKEQQMEVVCAADGAEGLTLFRQHQPLLVVTDLLMPKVDGFQLVEAIRREAAHNVAILVTSAIVRDRGVLHRLERDFAVQVLLKPFSPRILAEQVQRILSTQLAGKSGANATVEAAGAGAVGVQRAPAETPAGRRVSLPTSSHGNLAPTGDFSQTAVPALILSALEQRCSGVIELRHDKIQKRVYLLNGHPIFVQSSLREEALGPLLVARGVIDERQHRAALLLAQNEGIRFGEALVQSHIMDETRVMAELVAQTAHKLQECLRWRTGDWSYSEDESIGAQVPRCTVDPVRVVFEGLRRRPDVDQALARLGPALDTTTWVVPRPRLLRYREAYVEQFGSLTLDELGEGAPLAKLRRLDREQEMALQLEALLLSEMVSLRHQPAATVPRDASGGDSLASAGAGRLAEAGPIRRALSDVRRELSSLDSLSGQAASRAANNTAASAEHVRKTARTEEAPPARPPRRVTTANERVARQLIASVYLGLHHKTHYEILGIIPDTDSNGIEVAYQVKRRQFNLERYRGMNLGESYGHLEEICAALDHAFSVLHEPSARAQYDAWLRSRPASTGRSAMDAEASFQQARVALAEGRYVEALDGLAQARKLNDQPLYCAEQALAQFKAGGETLEAGQQAMALVQQALATGIQHPVLHVVAAKISHGLGSGDEAVQHLREAIQLDPRYREAFDELEAVLLAQAAYLRLEEEYRRTIYLLNNVDRFWAAELWKRLSSHYREHLADDHKAQLALQAARKLDPTGSAVVTGVPKS